MGRRRSIAARFVGIVAVAGLGLSVSGCASTAPQKSQAEISAANSTWTDDLEAAKTSLALIDVVDCYGEGSGTGFFVGPDLVLTAAHVVAGSVSVDVNVGNQSMRAEVLGLDPLNDVALLKTSVPVDGTTFKILDTDPVVGTSIATLGFTDPALDGQNVPAEKRFKISEGITEGFTHHIPSEVNNSEGSLVTNQRLINGDSGSPVIDESGTVVGMGVSSIEPESLDLFGTGVESFAVPSRVLRDSVEEWRGSDALPAANCQTGEGYGIPGVQADTRSSHDDASNIISTMTFHGDAINHGYFEEAFDLLVKPLQEKLGGLETWADRGQDEVWGYVQVQDVRNVADGLVAKLDVWKLHNMESEATTAKNWCTVSSNFYEFSRVDDTLVMTGATEDPTPRSCSEKDFVDQLGEDAGIKFIDMFGPMTSASEQA